METLRCKKVKPLRILLSVLLPTQDDPVSIPPEDIADTDHMTKTNAPAERISPSANVRMSP